MTKITTKQTKIAKTIKLYIGGEFPRTESGRSYPINFYKTNKLYANVCLASRKDFRNAVTVAKDAQASWQNKTSYNRGQILYRMAEMMQARSEELETCLVHTLGQTNINAEKNVANAISALVYYAGFCDKYQQVLGAVNPVSGPHHNFTTTEAVGVVGLIAHEKFDLVNFVAQLAAIIVSGNTVVALLSKDGSALLAPLASHMEVNSICCQLKDKKIIADLRVASAANLKRIHYQPVANTSLESLTQFLEFKTVWHPIGSKDQVSNWSITIDLQSLDFSYSIT